MSTVVDPDTNEHAVVATEAPPEAVAPETVECPNCGAHADAGQLMCLECGSRLALGYQRPPSWRLPAAIVGVLIYMIVRGDGMAERSDRASTHGTADELAKLADLKAQGLLDDAEFAAAKARLLG